MPNPRRRAPRTPPATADPADDATKTAEDPPEPESTTVKVTASLALAGLFERGETRTVERTPFVQKLIDNGKLTVTEE